ncbi:MAG: TIGR03546 family protein [Treponema sp.]|nr:TIGR03546 family protein [Treponema sp.]MCL2236837.1 TIGR03546 family protein [Treponema sp.]
MLKATAKLIQALNGNVKKSQIASGFAWGTLLGLIPAGNVFWIVLFLASFFFRHNHGSKIFGMALIKLISPLVIYAVDGVGFNVLNFEPLVPFFTSMYNMPFVPFTNFNNTLVMGGLVIGLILWIPVFILNMIFIPVYRNKLAPKIRESRIVKGITGFPLFKILEKTLVKD